MGLLRGAQGGLILLTQIKAYSDLPDAPTLPLSVDGDAETDFLQIRNVDGLDPVKASVGTSPYGSVDGESYAGSSVPSRNIVLTIGGNPDWATWTHASLRRRLYPYFMPKRISRLDFYSDDMDPVTISGVVEGFSFNQFSKDPEMQI